MEIVVWTGKCQGITIVPFAAGHTLGGTIWKIRSPSVGTIVYAVNMHHMKERHLDGTVLFRPSAGGIFEPLARPDLLITDACRANAITPRRKDRDAALIGAPCRSHLFFATKWIYQTRSALHSPLVLHYYCHVMQGLDFWNSWCSLTNTGDTPISAIRSVCCLAMVERC